MKILCVLTDWQTETVEKGKYKGQESRFRYVVCADNWNWFLATQSKDENGIPASIAFVGSMRLLMGLLSEKADFCGFKINSAVQKIAETLQKMTGKQVAIPVGTLSKEQLEIFGKILDDQMGLSFFKEYPPKVMKAVWGTEEKEDAEVVESST